MRTQVKKLYFLRQALDINKKILGARSFSQDFIKKAYIREASSSSESGNNKTPAPLSDSFGRRHNYLRISLTERCNLRCQYCMPAEGVPLSPRSHLLSRDELLRIARVFATLGVDKVRLTGGEPTLRADLADIIQGLSDIAGIRSVAMTTNAIALLRRLPALQRAGLTAINVSLDSLQPARYEQMARRPGLARVLAAVDLALQLGYRPVKINTVLMKGFNDDEICDFIDYTKDREVEVRFIEFMPFTGNKWDDSRLVPERDALRTARGRHPDLAPLPPRAHGTATVWQVPGYAGSVGFISSMTQPFCSSCNRLRLTADGNLKVCLFGAGEVSLRDAARGGASDGALAALVRSALANKKAAHAAGGRRLAARQYCSEAGAGAGGFSHLDAQGRARMVDVGDKAPTVRTARAECRLLVSARLLRLLRDARLPKGDALTVAEIAGAMAAKRTADLIPLCHPLGLEYARARVALPRGAGDGGGAVTVSCCVRVTANTGAEMEALTGCAVAALALYDMCKSVDRRMRITDLRLVQKAGGRSDVTADEAPPPVRPLDESPLNPKETYVPTNIMHV